MKRQRKVTLFCLLFVLSFMVFFYQIESRKKYIPELFQYIPKENNLLFTTGEIELLWTAVESNFGDVIGDQKREGFLRQFFKAIQEQIAEHDHTKQPIKSAGDLEQFGLDIKKGTIFSIQALKNKPRVLWLVHLKNQDAFIDLIASVTELDKKEILKKEIPSLDGRNYTCLSFNDEIYLSFPEPNLGIFCTDFGMITRSLQNQKKNLDFYRKNDALYKNAFQDLESPISQGQSLYIFFRPTFFSPLHAVSAILHLTQDGIRLNITGQFEKIGIDLIRSFFESPPKHQEWYQYLLRDTAFSFSVQQRDIARYIRYLSRMEVVKDNLSEVLETYSNSVFKDFFWELGGIDGLERISYAVTGYNEGLPDAVFQIWGNEKQLLEKINNLRIRLAKRRDLAIFRKALDAMLQDNPELRVGSVPETYTGKRLKEMGYIAREDFSNFDDYVLKDGVIYINNIQNRHFNNIFYTVKYNNFYIGYIAPKIMENDLRYRFKTGEYDQDILMNDRYRLAFIFTGGDLILATNPKDLKVIIDNFQSSKNSLSNDHTFDKGTNKWNKNQEIQAFMNMDRVISIGLLTPESAIEDAIKYYLYDFREHPSISLTLDFERKNDKNLITLDAVIIHRNKLGSS